MAIDLDKLINQAKGAAAASVNLDALIAGVEKPTPTPPSSAAGPGGRPSLSAGPGGRPSTAASVLAMRRGYIKPYAARPGFPAHVRLADGSEHEFRLIEGNREWARGSSQSVHGVNTAVGRSILGAQPGERVQVPGHGLVEVLCVRHLGGSWTPEDVKRYYSSFPHLSAWLKRPSLPLPPPTP